MTSPVVPPTETQTPGPSLTPPSTPAGEPTAAAPAAWKAPETAPAWARGKTPEEILGIAQTLYGVAERFNQTGQVPQAPAAPAPAAQPTPTYQPIQDDDFVTGGAVRQYVQQTAQQFQPVLQQTLQQTASMALGFARTQHAEAFQRFGPEIEAEVSRLPLDMRTLDNLKTIVDVVRGRHVDELAEEKARQLAATMAPTLRSNGNGAPGSLGPSVPSLTLQTDAIPDVWRQKALAVGLDDAAIADFCRAQGWTTKQFYDQFSKGQIAAAVAETPVNRLIQTRGA